MDQISLKITDAQKHISKPQQTESRFTPEEKQKLAKATMDFESLLTSMMLKSMTKTTGGLFGENSYGGDTLDTIFESEMAGYMTRSKSMGIAQSMYEKITGEELDMSLVRPHRIKGANNVKTFVPNEHPTINPSHSSIQRLKKYEDVIKKAAREHGVDEKLIKSIILTESAAKEDALSKAKAKGLMQLMDGTARDMGVRNVWNPAENIYGGTKYISKMISKYDGNLELALAAYNAGPGNVDKHGGIPPFEETKNYVTRVMGYLNSMEDKNG